MALTLPCSLAATHVYTPLSSYWRLVMVSVPKLVVLTVLLMEYFMLVSDDGIVMVESFLIL